MSNPSPSLFEPIVFSGMQATGQLHLGNYLGALKHFVNLQEKKTYHSCLYSIVDMHALTTNPDPVALMDSTRAVTAAYLASGIDETKSIIFNQSKVYQHAELAWIFNCVARIGWLNRMTQFKDKAGKNREKASLGLYAYPSLMAADILLYRATHVPIGDDQKQHIELTRDIAQKFNKDYSKRIKELNLAKKINNSENSDQNGAMDGVQEGFFPLTEPILGQDATRVMSLRDGQKKMSKSDESDFSRINLTDTNDLIAQKIRKAKTDSEPLPENLEDLERRPEANNLLSIYAALNEEPKEAALKKFSGKQFSEFKPKLIELAVSKLAPIHEKLRYLEKNPDHINNVLKKGAEKASVLAEKTMKDVKEIIGFL